MKNNIQNSMNFRNLIFILSVALISPAIYAHHSHASLDKKNIQQHTGRVTKYSWRMPHVFLRVESPNPEGKIVEYIIELLHPPAMIEYGWSKTTFKPGDQITWRGPADKNPNRYYSGLQWAEKADGSLLKMEKNVRPVEPSKDFSGLWVRDARVGFTYSPPVEWPYTEHGQKMVANFNEQQNPQLECQNPGPPKSTLLPYPVQISRPDNETFVIDYELRDQKRVLQLNKELQHGKPSKIGQSKAWLEGDTLVVETSNFIPDRWGNHTGVDSSEHKHLLERFSLIEDGYTLRIQMTITDPVIFTKPVEIDYYMKKITDRELVPSNCNLESARLFIEAGYGNK